MTTLPRYLAWLFLKRALLIALGLALLLTTFDLIAHARDVTEEGGNAARQLGFYALLRLPAIASLIVPLGALLAAIATLAQLVMGEELVVMRASGVSLYRIAASLLYATGVIFLVHFLIAEALVPDAALRLRSWQARDFTGSPFEIAPPEAGRWLRSGDFLVKAASWSESGRRVRDLSLLHRVEDGRIAGFVTAERAIWAEPEGETANATNANATNANANADGIWHLEGVRQLTGSGMVALGDSRLRLRLPLTPERLAGAARLPEEIPTLRLWQLSREAVPGDRAPHIYSLWLHRKFARPAASLAMVLLVMPLGAQMARRNLLLSTGFGAILAGFLLVVGERLLLALGEAATLPPLLAAWTPALLVASLAGWVLVRVEG